MAERVAAELRGQVPEGKIEEVVEQVRQVLALGVPPLVLQVALQLPRDRANAVLLAMHYPGLNLPHQRSS